jgi:hypothetical protein
MTIPDGEVEASRIEIGASKRSIDCGFGASEWEAFLEPAETDRLIKLGEQGYGTWGSEPETLERMKRIKSA